jgi:peptidoglycan-associated lipoprotein
VKEDAMGRWVGGLLAVAIVVGLSVGTGCGPKKKQGLGTDEYGTGGVGEEGLGGRGSLDQAQAGKLGGAGGPLDDLYFDYDSFDLDEEARSVLKRNADWLGQNRGARVEVEGHCDDRGTVEYNLALGAKRAAAAKSYLVSLGLSADRLTTISYGEELPLCHDPTEDCWQRNRRAHFVVSTE